NTCQDGRKATATCSIGGRRASTRATTVARTTTVPDEEAHWLDLGQLPEEAGPAGELALDPGPRTPAGPVHLSAVWRGGDGRGPRRLAGRPLHGQPPGAVPLLPHEEDRAGGRSCAPAAPASPPRAGAAPRPAALGAPPGRPPRLLRRRTGGGTPERLGPAP